MSNVHKKKITKLFILHYLRSYGAIVLVLMLGILVFFSSWPVGNPKHELCVTISAGVFNQYGENEKLVSCRLESGALVSIVLPTHVPYLENMNINVLRQSRLLLSDKLSFHSYDK